MSDINTKSIDAISKLIMLTRDDKLKWKEMSTTEVAIDTEDEQILSAFFTVYNGKKIRIFSRSVKLNNKTGLMSPASSVSAILLGFSTRTEVVLQIMGSTGVPIWSFPKEDMLKDLLSLIQYKVSGASDLIESLLNE